MSPTDPLVRAYVLAAIANGDRSASLGAIAHDDGRNLASGVAALAESMQSVGQDRARTLAQLAEVLRPIVREDAPLPARARGIVATLVTREVGARWMRESPLPASGFRTSDALRRTIAGLAEERSWRD